MTAVENWLITRLTTVTAISMMFIGSRSWPSATAQTDGGFSLAISFGPKRARRAAASVAPSPRFASLPNAATTAATSTACQDFVASCVVRGGDSSNWAMAISWSTRQLPVSRAGKRGGSPGRRQKSAARYPLGSIGGCSATPGRSTRPNG